MEYLFILVGLCLLWGGVYRFCPAPGKKWAFWGGLVGMLTVVYFQFVPHPYRLERMVFDLSQI